MSSKSKIIILSIILPIMSFIYGIFTKQHDIFINSIYTVICIFGFAIINKKFPVIKTGTFCSVIVFIILSLFAGRTLKIYNLIPQWDKILHFISGFILVSVGKEIFLKLNNNSINKRLMNIFAVLFAIASAGIWEIYEFSIDKILGTLAQNGSLDDTMWDIILGTTSSIISIIMKSR